MGLMWIIRIDLDVPFRLEKSSKSFMKGRPAVLEELNVFRINWPSFSTTALMKKSTIYLTNVIKTNHAIQNLVLHMWMM